MMKIATVVVTYNRKEDLLMNIKQQLLQSTKIFKLIIIDNASTDGTEDYLFQNGILNLDNVLYCKLDSNRGGAGGFEYGTRAAYDCGADCIMLMDDDGYMINENTLANIIAKIPESQPLFMLNPIVRYDEFNLTFALGKYKKVEDCVTRAVDGCFKDYISPFNGTFFPRELVDKIGYPNGDLFIYGDEADYLRRARDVGSFIATVTDSLYFHPTSQYRKMTRKIFGKTLSHNFSKEWREYYIVRNQTYYWWKIDRAKTLKILIKEILLQFIFLPDKTFKRIFYIFKGFSDGIRGRLGKNVEPY